MHEPTYRDALRASWKLAWSHKNLWSFGLFAMMLGQFGLADLLVKIGFAAKSPGVTNVWEFCRLLASDESREQLGAIFRLGPDRWIWFFWLMLMLLGLGISILFVAVVTQGALVYASAKFAKRPLTFPHEGKAWHKGVEHFWRLLGLNLLRKIFLALVAVIVVAATMKLTAYPTGGAHVLFVIIFVVAILIAIILSFLLMYAAGYVVVEEYRLGESLRAAWRLFLDHWFVSLEVGVILVILNIILIFAALTAMVYVFFVPMLVGNAAALWFHNPFYFSAGVVIGYVMFLLTMLLLSSIFTVFTTSVWTYLFVKMHNVGVKSRVLHLFRK